MQSNNILCPGNMQGSSFDEMVQSQRSPFPNHLSEDYYRRSEGQMPKKIRPPNSDEPQMRITVMKTSIFIYFKILLDMATDT